MKILEKIRYDLENQKAEIADNFRFDLQIAEYILDNPDKNPYDIQIKGLSKNLIKKRIESSYLRSPRNRGMWKSISDNTSKYFVLVSRNEKMDEAKVWFDKTQKLLYRYNRTDLTSKILWISLLRALEKVDIDVHLLESLKLFSNRINRKIVKDFIYMFENMIAGHENIDFIDFSRFNKRIEVLEDIMIIEDIDKILLDGNKEELQLVINDLIITNKTILEEFKLMMNDFYGKIKTIEENSIISLFERMNSPEFGYLLDTLFKLTKLKKNNEIINSFMPFTRSLQKFISKYNIKPIYPKESIQISIEDLQNLKYNGAEIIQGEIKNVSVISPGWKYNDTVIIKANVVEEKTNEDK